MLLTLGALAQRGLRYLARVSVSLHSLQAARHLISDIIKQLKRNKGLEFAKTSLFEGEKLHGIPLLRTTLCDQAHQCGNHYAVC